MHRVRDNCHFSLPITSPSLPRSHLLIHFGFCGRAILTRPRPSGFQRGEESCKSHIAPSQHKGCRMSQQDSTLKSTSLSSDKGRGNPPHIHQGLQLWQIYFVAFPGPVQIATVLHSCSFNSGAALVCSSENMETGQCVVTGFSSL